jgi:rfaE bifunctional protein kinase chain/domain
LDKQELKKIFDSFTSRKILVIGDVMVDSYLWGKVERISPEAPVPIISCQRKEIRLGGAANVALNLQSLGAIPVLCGVIGNNDSGTLFLKLMQDSHLENHGIYIVKDRPTTVKTRIIGGDQQLIRVDEETDKTLSCEEETAFIEHILKRFKKYSFDAVIFQDYDKGAITPEIIKQIISIAGSRKIPVLVDPKRRNFSNYSNATLFKPNFKEFCEGLKTDLQKSNVQGIFEAGKTFQEKNNIHYLMITLSEKGIFISNGKQFSYLPAHVRDIADVSGAGDTVIGVASLCLANGMSQAEIAAISNLAGGLVCEKVGVAPIDKKRLEEEAMLLDFGGLN